MLEPLLGRPHLLGAEKENLKKKEKGRTGYGALRTQADGLGPGAEHPCFPVPFLACGACSRKFKGRTSQNGIFGSWCRLQRFLCLNGTLPVGLP